MFLSLLGSQLWEDHLHTVLPISLLTLQQGRE